MLLASTGCGKKEAAAGPPGGAMPPPEVGVMVLQPTTVAINKDLVGRLAPFRSADVRARVPGVVQRRLYEEGSEVHKGQPLFQIDAAPMQALRAQAAAALAQAQANAANTRAAAARARSLIDAKFISRADYDNALAAERTAVAAVQAAQASLQAADINLGYATVRAPISGRAGKQQVTEGALVGQGEATLLTTVDQSDPMYIDFSMSVSEFAQVRDLGQDGAQTRVEVVLSDGTPYPGVGKLDFSGNVVDPATGAVQLRALIPNPDGILLPGSFVSLKAVLGQERNAFLVPQDAVQRDAAGSYALVVGKDGKVVRKDIVTERSEGTNWVVHEGVSAGDQLIVSGLQRAVPGEAVKAAPIAPAGNAPVQQAAVPAPAKG
ncbi:MAG: efflux RND transporter periplasmic adaptor subunit [Thermomonas sp.]